MSKQSWTVTDQVAGVVTDHASPHEQWDAVREAIGAPPVPKVEPWALRELSQTGQSEEAA